MKQTTYGLGYIQSPQDDRDLRFDAKTDLPLAYKLAQLQVEDQGSTSMCAAYTAATMIDWWSSVLSMQGKLDIKALYEHRSNKPQEGMIPRDVFKLLKAQPIKMSKGSEQLPITAYRRCYTIDEVKSAVVANGPVFVGMLVKDIDAEHFWKGDGNFGGHAVSIVGYTKDSFIIKNSWGVSWGDFGYTTMPFEDFSAIIEAWTILR